MAIFDRRIPKPVRKRYRSYKKFLREDFNFRCVFCSIHENDHGGYWHFHVEHYKPKSHPNFKILTVDYDNLLYSCDQCNILKGDSWPSDNPILENMGWLDPCLFDFDEHYKFHLIGEKLELNTYSGVGVWMSKALLLDNSIRIEVLQKIALRNKLDIELLQNLKQRIEILINKNLICHSETGKQEISELYSLYLRLKKEQEGKYLAAKFQSLRK